LGTLVPKPGTQTYVPVVLDMTSGSGSLTVSCAEAGISSIAYELDFTQAKESVIYIRKFFSKSGFLEPNQEREKDPAALTNQSAHSRQTFARVVEEEDASSSTEY